MLHYCLLSHIHVHIVDLPDTMCMLIAIRVMLGRLECTCLSNTCGLGVCADYKGLHNVIVSASTRVALVRPSWSYFVSFLAIEFSIYAKKKKEKMIVIANTMLVFILFYFIV